MSDTNPMSLDAVVRRFEESREQLDRFRKSLEELQEVGAEQRQHRQSLEQASIDVGEVAKRLQAAGTAMSELQGEVTSLVATARDLVEAADVSILGQKVEAVVPELTSRIESLQSELAGRLALIPEIESATGQLDERLTAIETKMIAAAEQAAQRESELSARLEKALAALGPRKAAKAGLA